MTDTDLNPDLGYIQHWRDELRRVACERDDAETCLEDWDKAYDMVISPESVAFGKDVAVRRRAIIARRRDRQTHPDTATTMPLPPIRDVPDNVAELQRLNVELRRSLHHTASVLSQVEAELMHVINPSATVQRAINACRTAHCYGGAGADPGLDVTGLSLEQRCYAATQYVISLSFSGSELAQLPVDEIRHNVSQRYNVTDAEMTDYIDRQTAALDQRCHSTDPA